MSKRAKTGAVVTGLLLVIMLGGITSGCSSSSDEVKLTVESCDIIARGEVKNTSDRILDVFITVDFVDRKGIPIDSGLTMVEWLEPGQAMP